MRHYTVETILADMEKALSSVPKITYSPLSLPIEMYEGTLGLELYYSLDKVKHLTDNDWDKLILEARKKDIVVIGNKDDSRQCIQFCRGEFQTTMQDIYFEALDMTPYDEGDQMFHEWLKLNISAINLGKLLGVSVFYACCAPGGAHAGAEIPQHVVEQAKQAYLIITFRHHLRVINEREYEHKVPHEQIHGSCSYD
ncbi:hypothetical protein [Xenorhabdus bharatensis]|uniref:hypothetical protein n=1 Tax=Xenorhabdus bharatensis TaxID=3136256 RepID=UPI0030F45671